MGTLLVIAGDQPRGEFMEQLRAKNIEFKEFAGLPRQLHLPSVEPKDLPQLAGVEFAESDGLPSFGTADHPVSISANFTGGNWGILRATRRRPPWFTGRLDYSFPLESFYRSGDKTGVGVDVYVLDSGVRLTHTEVSGRAVNEYEFYSSAGVGDDFGHGTGVSACAAGATRGLARDSNIRSYKCLNNANAGTNLALTSAISEVITDYSASSNPGVVNMSLVGFGASINSAVSSMIDAGLVVVVSAGNTMSDLGITDQFPAESDAEVIVVGGINPADTPYYSGAFGSNYGTRIDVSAASQAVHTAYNTSDNAFVLWEGTSFGAPIVSGAIACMLQGETKLTTRAQVQAVRAYVRNNATVGFLQNAHGITLPDRILYFDAEVSGSIF
jgi:subtilisin family serine protease